MKAGMAFLKIVSPFYFIISLKLLADGLLRGSSAMIGFMVSTFTDLILRVILAYVFAGLFGSTGIWWSWAGWMEYISNYFVVVLPIYMETIIS